MGGRKNKGQQQGDGGGFGGQPRPQGQQPRQGGWQPRGPRGPPHQGGPRGPPQQGGPGQSGFGGPQGHHPRQGGQWQPRGPRRPSPQQQGGPDQQGQGHQPFHQGPRYEQGPGPRYEQGPGPRYEQGPGPQRGFQDRPRDQGFQQGPPPQELAAAFPPPAWGKKAQPVQEPPAQQPAPVQPPSAAPAEAQSKGKGKGKGKGKQQAAPTDASSVPPVAAAAAPVAAAPAAAASIEQKAQPTPDEAKPEKKKQKGKGQDQTPAPAATPSPSAAAGDVAKKVEKLTLQTTFKLPERKVREIVHQGPHVARKFVMEVNYLPLKIKDPKLKIYHYDVNFNPETPKYLLRKALEQMRLKHFSNRHPAFDGSKNMYVAGKPLNDRNATIRDTVTVYNHETCRDKDFDVTIKLVNDKLDLSKIFQYCQKGITSDIPQTEIQATDIALRSGLTNNFTPAGRSFFAPPTRDPTILGGGMELWHGFYQSAVAAWKPYLNIDVANKAFPIQQTVMDYMYNEMRCGDADFRNGLNPDAKRALEKFLKGLKISYEMPNPGGPVQKRIYKVTGLGGTPIEESFKPKDGAAPISVGHYYAKEKGYQIRYARLPLLKIGTQGSMVPIELCSIIGDQAVMRKLDENQTAAMVKAAARPTWERKERIDANIQRANYNANPTLREFGIEVQTAFEKVEAVVIRAPSIQYKSRPAEVRDGVWRLERDNFLEAKEIPPWAVLCLNSRTYPQKINELERLMVSVGSGLGMRVPQPYPFLMPRGRVDERDIDKCLSDFGNKGVKLVIVVLNPYNENYGQVKRASELRTGVLTQCIKGRTIDRINPMTITNILLKVNAKLTGTNHSLAPINKPPILNKPCMFVGADVTHPSPGPGAEGTPSIAAVAASMDRHGFQYKMLYRLQPSRQEMILDLAEIMKEQILSFIGKLNVKPERIVYFRDGVSEGQFQQVLNAELVALRRACKMVHPDYEPAITFLVVQKRHHTRFFPSQRDGDRKNQNVPAGTLVDRQITHPTEVDFFLVSHQSIQGTARPTKYHLLWDDNNFDQIELEKLTYYLCHMFSRCTRAVSYPAPTYYAHLAAFRARAWWDSMSPNMAKLQEEQTRRGTISTNILTNFPMFFT